MARHLWEKNKTGNTKQELKLTELTKTILIFMIMLVFSNGFWVFGNWRGYIIIAVIQMQFIQYFC